ncbi:Fur family transcriptional regulator [Pseudopedobacter beijingensis]|uniref:Fur family transcriptional regulator n=1 Tax=Pseudopedobacter beijingensis TaxID=1207056 RepID=A0ABW4IBK5_9SPHI
MRPGRNTAARTEILGLINKSEAALSHTEIQAALDGLCDRVTIYRVLDRLTAEGLIHKIINMDGVVKYAYCHECSQMHRHNHIHFSCEKCKKVTCLEGVEPVFKLPEKYKVNEVNFTVSGLCPKCS